MVSNMFPLFPVALFGTETADNALTFSSQRNVLLLQRKEGKTFSLIHVWSKFILIIYLFFSMLKCQRKYTVKIFPAATIWKLNFKWSVRILEVLSPIYCNQQQKNVHEIHFNSPKLFKPFFCPTLFYFILLVTYDYII